MWTILACVLVGLIWGSTNPFVKRGSLKVEQHQLQRRSSRIAGLLSWLEPSLLIPWLLNQSGSVLFTVLLANAADISRAVPIANAVSIAANAVADLALREQYNVKLLFGGVLLVAAGVLLCML